MCSEEEFYVMPLFYESLQGLEGLLCLMELYAQNNLLLDICEINYIGNLPKLMVVNLSGNALCGTHDYRLYTIYTLRKLKVWVQD